MKKILQILIMFVLSFGLILPGYTYTVPNNTNVLNVQNKTIEGKFESIVNGLIIIYVDGVRQSYTRIEDNNDIYTDLVTYRIKPFSRKTRILPCRVEFLDNWTVKIKIPNSDNVEIPRYRITALEINIK